MKKFFITATDTDAGKTYVACSLIHALTKLGKKVAVYKPISAGCEVEQGQLVNEDAKLLMQSANSQQSLSQINPIAFLEPIAPHIAANKQNKEITIAEVCNGYSKVLDNQADVIITEGAGGWRLPLGNNKYLSEFAFATKQDVILIVNMKLGCLNHARLTYEAIVADGLNCIAWVANSYTAMPYLDENIAELKQLLPVPLIAQLGFCSDTKANEDKFDLSPLR